MSENTAENNHRSRRRIRVIKTDKKTGQFLPARTELFAKMGFTSDDRMGLIQTIRKGVNYTALNVLADSLSISVNDLSHYVDISDRTLIRRKKQGLLNPDETERVYRVGSLLVRATEVLQDKDEALRWLKTPKKALGGEVPLDLADTEVGADEVKDLLGRIEHGVFT